MILRVKTIQVETKGRTIRDLIKTLDEKTFGELEKRVLAADSTLDPKFRIFVNGMASDSLATTLSDGDDVLLFSVIDGG
jgi:molybdopterin converting factor small subunit